MSSTQTYLQKISFWQKLSAIVVTIIGLSLLAIITQTMLVELNRSSWDGSPAVGLDSFMIFVWSCFLAFCISCIILTVLLWRSARALDRYRLHSVITDLEQSFRFQRYFWIGGTMIIGILLILVLLTMVLG